MLYSPNLKTIEGFKERYSPILGLSSTWNLGLSFDFFIDWSNNELKNVFFIKRCWNSNEPSINEMIKENSDYLLSIKNNYNIDINNFNILSFNEFEFNENMNIYLFKFYKNNQFNFINLSLNDLKNKIIIPYSGGEVKMGLKGLTWFTTKLEKELSFTTACYPGDCDSMLFHNSNPIGIIEFQKRTTDVNDFLSKNHLYFDDLYNGNQKRKCERLILLAKQFDKEKEIPLYFLHYHTSNEIKKICLEEIDINTKKQKNIKEFDYSIVGKGIFKDIKDYIIENYNLKNEIHFDR